MLTRLVLIAATLVACSRGASAQGVATYVSIVDQYAGGDSAGAVNRMAPETARLPIDIVQRMRASTPRQIRSAAMLHTELAAAWLALGKPAAAAIHVANARRLLDVLADDTRYRAAAEPFAVRWYAFVIGLYAEQGLFDQAYRVAREGLDAFPRASELYVARGAIQEMRATMSDNSRTLTADRFSIGVRRAFEAAGVDYQHAVNIDKACAIAYLHRGWIHFRVDDDRAHDDLTQALNTATDDGVRYLAHLFLGAVAERRGDLPAARREYEAANALGSFQTSAVALGRIETALGHADRARAVSTDYAAHDAQEDPWWSYRLGGFMPGAVTWLREEARRP